MSRAPAPPRAVDTIHQPAIDQALAVLDRDRQRLADRLGIPGAALPSSEQLRAGPLGQDLRRLALVADGRLREPAERVLSAIASVLGLLFWPAGGDEVAVPRAFWATNLGRMLARAKYRAFAGEALVGIAAAARQLGVSRPTIYRWMEDGSLDHVRDDRSGRTFLLRRGVDERERIAAALRADGHDPERWRLRPISGAADAAGGETGVAGWETEGGAIAHGWIIERAGTQGA
jgi:excisionase family DNA binding protein